MPQPASPDERQPSRHDFTDDPWADSNGCALEAVSELVRTSDHPNLLEVAAHAESAIRGVAAQRDDAQRVAQWLYDNTSAEARAALGDTSEWPWLSSAAVDHGAIHENPARVSVLASHLAEVFASWDYLDQDASTLTAQADGLLSLSKALTRLRWELQERGVSAPLVTGEVVDRSAETR